MASLSNRNSDDLSLFHEIHHFVDETIIWNYYIVIMQAIKFSSSSFQVDALSLF